MPQSRFSTSIDIAARPDRVWSVMRDVERWSEWTPSVTSIELLDGALTVGARARVRQPRLPVALWEVTDIQEGREFTWVSRARGILVLARHGVAPVAGGTRATLSIEYSGALGPLLARLTRAINDQYLALEAEGLKARSEGSS
jgi:carbon monoxide dehydrogenase subunit G